MSNEFINAVWSINGDTKFTKKNGNKSKLTSGEKLVLLSLADRANDNGECWPSVEDISKRCGMSDRNVNTILADLQAAGLVFVVTYGGIRTKSGYTNLYKLTIKGVNSTSPDGVNSSSGVNHTSPDGVNHTSPDGVNHTSPKPSYNPHSNHHHNDAQPSQTEAAALTDFWPVYEQEIGSITPIISQKFGMYFDEGAPVDWMIDAVHIAAENNKRKASYVFGCLDRAIAKKVSPRLVFDDNKQTAAPVEQRQKITQLDDYGREVTFYV